MKTISLTQGKVARVDDADYEWLVQRGPWHAAQNKGTWYAKRSYKVGSKVQTERMHRVILGLPTGHLPEADHKDGDGLNNQRHNLRKATRSNNNCNRALRKDNVSGIRGATWDERRQKWQVRIGINGKRICLGNVATLKAAAQLRLKAEAKHHAEFSASKSRGE